MLPPSFTAYRRDLEAARMPCLPYLGLVFQQLIHLDSGNLQSKGFLVQMR